MLGSSGDSMGVSETTAASQASRSVLFLTKSSRLTLPTSSSPSNKNFMFTGSLPFAAW